MFPSSHFWFLVTFGVEVMKMRKYYVIFDYILQGKMGKTEKKQKENHATKVTKMPKTKRRKYGMNETIVQHILWVDELRNVKYEFRTLKLLFCDFFIQTIFSHF